jgi:hypothetical protein
VQGERVQEVWGVSVDEVLGVTHEAVEYVPGGGVGGDVMADVGVSRGPVGEFGYWIGRDQASECEGDKGLVVGCSSGAAQVFGHCLVEEPVGGSVR